MEGKPPVTLKDALLHQRFVVLAIVGAFVLAAGVLSLRPPMYEASAAIYLDTSRMVPGFDAGVSAGELLQHDFIVLATSRPVLQRACATPGVSCAPGELATPESTLAHRVVVSVFRGTSMLTVAARAPAPDEAAALSNAVARAMIDQNTTEVIRLFKPARDSLEKELTDLSSTMEQERLALQKSPAGSSTAVAHENQLASLQSQYSATYTRLQDIAQQQDRLSSVATLLQPALPPASPAAPSPGRYLLTALIAGLAVGLVSALLMERFGGRIQSAEGLARAAGIPVALVAPRPDGHPPAADQRPYSLALASLLARSPDARPILVMAASARDHSDAVATALGAVAAQSGQRAVVVQADGHAADPDWFTPEVAGLTTIAATSDNGIGPARAVAAVRKQYDFESADTLVLVSVPSPDLSPTAIQLGRTTGRAVLTATAGVTRYRDARRTAELLQRSGIEVVVGIVVARRPVRLFR